MPMIPAVMFVRVITWLYYNWIVLDGYVLQSFHDFFGSQF